MANPNNWKQNSEPKPEFTDYTVAGTDEGRHSAALLRINYEAQRAYIRTGRSLRRMCRKTANPCRTEGDDVRCGYPKKRERNEDIPSHRGVPHSNFLKRFKVEDRLVCYLGDFIYSAKVYVLHATRGWKLYA